MLVVCQQVAAIPMKRVAPPETRFLERDEVQALLRHLPSDGRLALRDRGLILFLYNTGARVQEAADLRVEHLDLGEHPLVRLHGKGDKWRTCPLWHQTASLLSSLLQSLNPPPTPKSAVFSAHGQPLTRFGIYKIVRRHGARFDNPRTDSPGQPAHLPAHRRGAPSGGRRRGQRHPRLARPRRSDHDQSLRRNQHEDQVGGTPGQRACGYYGGIPHQANLEDRRISPQLAGITLICYVAGSSPPALDPKLGSVPRPHNPVGHRSRLCARAT